MFLSLRFALRYSRTRKRGLVRLTSSIAVAGIGLGVAGLIVAQAIGRGFEAEMRDRILASTAHITVQRQDGTEMREENALRDRLSKVPGVTAIRSNALSGGVISTEDRSESRSVLVRVDEGQEVPSGRVHLGIRIGGAFASDRTSRVILTLAGTDRILTLDKGDPFSTGIYEYDSMQVRVSKDDFARLEGLAVFVPYTLSVSVHDIYRSDSTAQAIRDSVGGDYRVIDWQEANRPLFSALSLERRGALIVISVILAIALFNITTTMSLLITERRLDVAVLRACGAAGGTIVRMFVIEGAFFSFAGVLLGSISGTVACAAINRFGLLSLPPEVYSISEIPLRPEIREILVIGLGTLLAAALASLVPAVRAVGVKPSENLRRQ